MAKKYFTADWHNGEQQLQNAHSFLRPRSTEVMIKEWLSICEEKISPDDTFYFLGDLAITLEDIKIYKQLPQCRKILVMGDKEYANKNFTYAQFWDRVKCLDIFDEIHMNMTLKIGDIDLFASHKPTDCLDQPLPALCGHIHGIWRTQQMPNKQPIINVGVDAWGGLVTEEFILHQYNAVTKGYYDENAFSTKW
jgi:calcineurin-like phosphoesterase family protein